MHVSVMVWLCLNINEEDVKDKEILEVGSQNVNGSIRDYVLKFNPKSYLGVDFQSGKGVDKVVNAEDLIKTFGSESFDVVISTEMLEHVRDWKVVIHNLKQIVKKRGLLIITTRSIGFGYHAYPYDFWRYQVDDFKTIFRDFEILKLEKDEDPGVLLKAKKPLNYFECNIEKIALYSMLTNRRELETPTHFRLIIKLKMFFKNSILLIGRKVLFH